MHAQFTIEQRFDYYSYTFTSDDRNILFFSRLYASLRECRKEIQSLQSSPSLLRYVEKTEVNGGYSFLIRDKKGEILGHGVVYFASSSRDYAIRKFVLQREGARITGPIPTIDRHTIIETNRF